MSIGRGFYIRVCDTGGSLLFCPLYKKNESYAFLSRRAAWAAARRATGTRKGEHET